MHASNGMKTFLNIISKVNVICEFMLEYVVKMLSLLVHNLIKDIWSDDIHALLLDTVILKFIFSSNYALHL